MDLSELLDRLCERAPFKDRAAAHAAAEGTLCALGRLLGLEELRRVSEDLGPSLSRLLVAPTRAPDAEPSSTGAYSFPTTLDDFYRIVARQEWVSLSLAVEHAQIVCEELGTLLPQSTMALFEQRMPALRDLFEPPRLDEEVLSDLLEPTETATRVEHRSTLAEGRPGSRHPLSEGRPRSGHTDSIAASDDPHGDTKLSTSSGFTQERERETLASGRPGSKRPLSG